MLLSPNNLISTAISEECAPGWGEERIEELPVPIFNYDLTSVCLTRHIIATNMHVHESPNLPCQQCSLSRPKLEGGTTESLDLTAYDWKVRLEFIPSQKPISAAEYSCWHALVEEHLSPCQHSTNSPAPREIDVQFAQLCLGEIAKVHRHLDG